MKSIRTTLHHGVMPEERQSNKQFDKERGPHLRAGELSNACVYSVMSALIALRVVKLDGLYQAPDFDGGMLEKLWARTKDDYPAYGRGEDFMPELLAIAKDHVHATFCPEDVREQAEFATGRLKRGELVLLRLGAIDGKLGRWTLGIGVEEEVSGEATRVTSILCLDAAELNPALARFNARLDLYVSRPGVYPSYRYATASGATRMLSIYQSISLRRARARRTLRGHLATF